MVADKKEAKNKPMNPQEVKSIYLKLMVKKQLECEKNGFDTFTFCPTLLVF